MVERTIRGTLEKFIEGKKSVKRRNNKLESVMKKVLHGIFFKARKYYEMVVLSTVKKMVHMLKCLFFLQIIFST